MLQSLLYGQNPIYLLVNIAVLVIALSVHEWGHAYAAYRCGDPTAKALGRMTLNPLQHFDIFGFLSLLFFHFGWGKPVPINPRNFRDPVKGEIIVSLAGVTLNFCLAFVGILFFSLFEIYTPGATLPLLFFNSMAQINLGLMFFNLIPIYPLDGYHVLKMALLGKLSYKFFWTMERYGNIIMLAAIVLGLTSMIIGPLSAVVYNGLYTLFGMIFA